MQVIKPGHHVISTHQRVTEALIIILIITVGLAKFTQIYSMASHFVAKIRVSGWHVLNFLHSN